MTDFVHPELERVAFDGAEQVTSKARRRRNIILGRKLLRSKKSEFKKSSPQELVRRSLEDPSWWVSNVVGNRLWRKQNDILKAIATESEVAVASCHGAGKSFTAAHAAAWYLYNHKPSVVLTTAPTDRQVRKILWKEIRRLHSKAIMPLGGQALTQELRLDNDWFAIGFTAPEHASDKFQGFHSDHMLIIVDEASGVSEEIFEGIDGIASGSNATILMISNPILSSGRFSTAFRDPRVKTFNISAFDTPNFTKFNITMDDIRSGEWVAKYDASSPAIPGLITPAWVDRQYKRRGEDSPFFVTRVLGQFPDEGDDVLIPFSWVEMCQKLEPSSLDEDDVTELGVDVARFGDDESVIAVKSNGRVDFAWFGEKRDTMTVSGKVAEITRRTGASIVKVDVIGLGAGVVDRLNEIVDGGELKGVEIFGVNSSASPESEDGKERFLNLRAEMYWNLRELVQKKRIKLPYDETLAVQMSSLKYNYTSNGKIKIESKEEIRKRMKQSPDRSDAVAIAAYPVETNRGEVYVGRAW